MSDEVTLPGDRLIEQLAALNANLQTLKPLADVAAALDIASVNKLVQELSRLLAVFAPHG